MYKKWYLRLSCDTIFFRNQKWHKNEQKYPLFKFIKPILRQDSISCHYLCAIFVPFLCHFWFLNNIVSHESRKYHFLYIIIQ